MSHIVPFSGHEPENRQFHIFLLHLKTPLKLNTPYVKAACLPVYLKSLPGSDQQDTNLEARQGGFGSPSSSDGSSSLKLVEIKLGSKEACSRLYRNFYKGTSEHVQCGTAKGILAEAISDQLLLL